MKRLFAILFLVSIVALAGFLILRREKAADWENAQNLKLASFWEEAGQGIVRCNLCPNHCLLSKGQLGLCKARKNIGGKLYSLNYGRISTQHIDPVEKKPFFHVLPGAQAYSIATTGCNMRCSFCQNWNISQVFPWEVEQERMSPQQVVDDAAKKGSPIIAFTYNEPTIFYEYTLDIAKLARERGLKTVVVSSGYINPEPLKELLPHVDAYKIDLKAFQEEFYQEFIGGHLEPVLEALKIIKEKGVWLEIVNLLVPGENDSEEEIREMARWIKDNLGDGVPLHFSRFHPDYKLLNLPPTPEETVRRARQIAMEEGLKYVYTGNLYFPEGETTFCPDSHQAVIERQGYAILSNKLTGGKCASGEEIPGIWR